MVCARDDDVTQLSVPSATLSVVAGLALIVVSHFEHVRSKRSSFLIGFYLTMTLLLKLAMIRTYWHISGYRSIASTALTSVLVQAVVLGLETYGKGHPIGDRGGSISAESSAGFLSRSLFTWLNPLLATGYRRTLSTVDLHIIDESLEAAHVVSSFDRLQTTPKCMRAVVPLWNSH